MIDTGKVTNRRDLHFTSIDEALADADALAQLERDANLQQLGNWTLGQALGHLGTWCGYAFDGTPLHPPWVIRFILKFSKNRFIRKPMKSGAKIPGVENGTLATAIMSTDAGLRLFRDNMQRMSRECPAKPNVIFGPLTHEEWINLQLRHAELHLSFFKPAV